MRHEASRRVKARPEEESNLLVSVVIFSTMSQALTLMELKERRKKIEEELQKLKAQLKEIEEKHSSILKEEKRLYEELKKYRSIGDLYGYNRVEMRLNVVARSKSEVESLKAETERRIKGCLEDLKRIDDRIKFLKPKVKFIVEKPPS